MGVKNIKVDESTWRELAKQKIDLGVARISDVVQENILYAKRFGNKSRLIEWFKENYKSLGFEKLAENETSESPTFTAIQNKQEIRVGLETLSSHAVRYGRDLAKIDLILCIIRDTELPVRTIELPVFSTALKNYSGLVVEGGLHGKRLDKDYDKRKI